MLCNSYQRKEGGKINSKSITGKYCGKHLKREKGISDSQNDTKIEVSQTQRKSSFLYDLPTDVLIFILSFNPEPLVRVIEIALVNHTYYNLVNSPSTFYSVYSKIYLRKF